MGYYPSISLNTSRHGRRHVDFLEYLEYRRAVRRKANLEVIGEEKPKMPVRRRKATQRKIWYSGHTGGGKTAPPRT